MEKAKLERINALAKKSKLEELTEEEKREQTALRNEYRNEFRGNFINILDNTYIVDGKGEKTKVLKKGSEDGTQ